MTKLTYEEAHRYFEYNPETGDFSWKDGSGFKVIPGEIAGTISCGYRQIRVNGKFYKVHRVIWLMMTGGWPKEEIDHINLNKSDNRWCNLREANRVQNNLNKTSQKNNKLGVKGVKIETRTKVPRYYARIRINGEDKYLGCFPSLESAKNAYDEAAKQHHKDFARS